MAKPSYKIPDSIDRSYLQNEIYLKNKEGVGLNKPVTLFTVFAYFFGCLLLAYVFKHSFLLHANLLDQIVFAVLWLAALSLMLTSDATKRYGFHLFLTLLNYMVKSRREILPKRSDSVSKLRTVNNLGDIRKSDGLIQFWSDGTVGYVYRVVGNASVLMFDQDKQAVTNRMSSFLKQLPEDVTVIFDTGKEAQNVDRQLNALKQRRKARLAKGEFISEGLNALERQQYDILKNHIGGAFKSLNQYMVIKAKSMEALAEVEAYAVQDANTQQFIFKRIERIGYEDTVQYYKGLYL